MRKTLLCDPTWELNLERFRPDVVIFVVSPLTGDLEYRGRWSRPCTAWYDRAYASDLTKAVKTLGSRGAKVVMTTAAYVRYGGFILAALDRPVDCDNRVRRKVAKATGAQLVDLSAYTCPDRKCRTEVDGVKLRPDGLHYEGPSARVVNRWILNQIGAPSG